MQRDALRLFLRRLVLASLPLGGLAGCGQPAAGAADASAALDGAGLVDASGPGEIGAGETWCPQRYVSGLVRRDLGNGPGGSFTETDCTWACMEISRCGGGPAVNYADCGIRLVDLGLAAVGCNLAVRCGVTCGRRPAGLVPARVAAADSVAEQLALAAHLEAASVVAFERLAEELAAFGAPPALVAEARRAAADEVRHARVMATRAERRGAIVPAVEVTPLGARTLVDLAVENAVEGCVGETWGAVVAMWQGEMAGDREIRAAMRRIAGDEAGHGELAWQVASWARTRLDDGTWATVIALQRAAARQLAAQIEAQLSDGEVTVLGLPRPEQARRLMAGVAPRLWA